MIITHHLFLSKRNSVFQTCQPIQVIPLSFKENKCMPTTLLVVILTPSVNTNPLRMIVSRTAGTGKSYLIMFLKSLLGHHLIITAPTGVAAFNVNGYTLHSMLRLPVKGDFKDLESTTLQNL